MKVFQCIVLALVSAAVYACSTRGAAEAPAARAGQLAAAGHQAPAPVAHSSCAPSDDAEGPYAEEADLLSICAQRALPACESADGLCHLLRALPIDVRQRCSRPSEAVACMPVPAADAPVALEVDVVVCREDAEGNTWAIGNLDAPPDWKPLALDAPAEWREGCEDMARCED